MKLYRFCFLTLSICLGWASMLSAQSKRAFMRAGDKAFENKDYTSAFTYYSNALQKSPDDADILWKYAESARVFYAFGLAEKAYSIIEKQADDLEKHPLTLLRLGELNRMQGRYTKAIGYFEAYQKLRPDTADLSWKQAARDIAHCQWAIAQPSQPETPVNITHLDKKINSPYSDFAGLGRGDTLYFSSYRFERKGSEQKQRMSRLMMSIGGRNAREPMRGLPAGDSAHVAHAAFSPTGDFLIFNYCKNINPNDLRCELWLTVKDIKGKWTKPVRLPEPINQTGATSTQPSISMDAQTGQLRLWFSSDRPGGKGGLDVWSVPLDTIWFCPCNKPLDAKRPQKLPRFDTPKPVTEANTALNDITPFFHGPSNTLYFSSEGWLGFGGYDVFQSKLNNHRWTTPTNLGAGVNSSYNDLYYTLRDNGRTGYLSSNRPGAYYLDERNKACCNDIYAVAFPEVTKPPVPLENTLEPPVVSKSPDPVQTTPLPLPTPVLPPQLQDFIGLPLYFDNDEPDRRTRKTTTRQTYEATVLNYLQRQDEYRQRRSEGLPNATADQAEKAVDDFFDNEVRTGYERLGQLCELLQTKLQAGQSVEIFIKGFTSPRAQSDYNLNLGKRRISSVRNHIAEWSEGALQPYIQTGQLRITETSFGETTARLGLSDDLKDERNSVYHPDAARERRVEIVEIK